MPLYIAFLRGINVGGHTVKMETLRRLFESAGFSGVQTYIASGNVVFHSTSQDVSALQSKISTELRDALGYEVATFIRTREELAQIIAFQAFAQAELEEAESLNVVLLSIPPDDNSKQKIMALTSEIDSFTIHAREVYWLCRRKQSESSFSNTVLEKTLGIRSTIRGMNTVRKLLAWLDPLVTTIDHPTA